MPSAISSISVLIEHCCIPMGDEAILNETATVNTTLAVLKEIEATPELSSRHQKAAPRPRRRLQRPQRVFGSPHTSASMG